MGSKPPTSSGFGGELFAFPPVLIYGLKKNRWYQEECLTILSPCGPFSLEKFLWYLLFVSGRRHDTLKPQARTHVSLSCLRMGWRLVCVFISPRSGCQGARRPLVTCLSAAEYLAEPTLAQHRFLSLSYWEQKRWQVEGIRGDRRTWRLALCEGCAILPYTRSNSRKTSWVFRQ